jgi:hypothetical protein
LALTYSSAKGNGLVGVGWDLAREAIQRDSARGIPKYDDTLDADTFVFSGKELVYIGEGTYRSVGAGESCSWALYAGGNAVKRGDGAEAWTVTISPAHTLFRTGKCGTWEHIGE